MDDSLRAYRILNINYLIKSPYGYPMNGSPVQSKRMLAKYSSTTQRNREPSKVEEIHSR